MDYKKIKNDNDNNNSNQFIKNIKLINKSSYKEEII